MAGGERRYPLEAARQLRGHAVDEAEAEVARAASSLGAAERRAVEAHAALSAHAARWRRDEEAIARREDAGGTAAELARGHAFRLRGAREQATLGQVVRDAQAAQVAAAAAVQVAREALAAVRAEHRVVERHHDRFRNEEKKEREARDEAEAEDLAAARRHRPD